MFLFPKDFLNSLRSIPHFRELDFLSAHETQKLPVSIRLNPFKATNLEFDLFKRVPWADLGYYLAERPVFTADPLFHAGCYYVQEASSMFIEFALKQAVDFNQDLNALDLCGAPGGKTTILSSLLNASSLLVANEVVKNRADILTYNLAKWGNCNNVVTNNESASFSGIKGLFDVVLVDAPCSGSGLFRKQPEAVNEWSRDAVLQCSHRQNHILTDIIPAIKTGGVLVYSTCSYSVEENEEVVRIMMEKYDLELLKLEIPDGWGIEDTGLGYRFYPYKLEGEGFFCAVLRKVGEESTFKMSSNNAFKEASKTERETLDRFFECGFETKVIDHSGEFKLMNNRCLQFINNTKNKLYFKQVGTSLGELKHGSLTPHHFLALSNYTGPEVEALELTVNESLKYLKKENFQYNAPSLGLKRITCKGFGIGWAKVLNNRVNNYLPSNYAIFNKEIGLSK